MARKPKASDIVPDEAEVLVAVPEPAKPRRPTEFTDAVASIILERMTGGESLKTICTDETMPLARTVYSWIAATESFRNNYARACEERADAIFEEALEIADDGTNDWMIRNGKDGEETAWALNGEHVQRSKLRVDARKWFLAKMLPKKYGERQTVEHDISDNLASRLEAARRRG